MGYALLNIDGTVIHYESLAYRPRGSSGTVPVREKIYTVQLSGGADRFWANFLVNICGQNINFNCIDCISVQE